MDTFLYYIVGLLGVALILYYCIKLKQNPKVIPPHAAASPSSESSSTQDRLLNLEEPVKTSSFSLPEYPTYRTLLCPECGIRNFEDSRFCVQCGYEFE